MEVYIGKSLRRCRCLAGFHTLKRSKLYKPLQASWDLYWKHIHRKFFVPSHISHPEEAKVIQVSISIMRPVQKACTQEVLWNGVAEVRLLLALKWQKLYKCLHTQGDSKSTGRGTSLKQSGQDHQHCSFLSKKNQNARKEQQYNNNYIMTHLRHCPIDLSCTEAILKSFDHFVSCRISP